jgi:hypothetical protein
MRRFATHVILVFVFFALAQRLPAVQLVWENVTWPAGSLTNSFDVDPANAGNDLTLTFTGNTGQFQQSFATGNPLTPANTRWFDGGFSPGHRVLELSLDLPNDNQDVTLTINFSALYTVGVSNVSFTLFDIDFANGGGSTYQDLISSITATSTTGVTIAPTITAVGPNVSLSGSGVSQMLTGMASTADFGAGSGDANATISFNAPDIQSITFTYGSTSLFGNPTYQHIGIDDLSYSVVPEPSPLACCLTGFGILAARIWYRRTKQTC